MPQIEFVIPRRPVSRQARRQARMREWKEFVAARARLAIVEPYLLAASPVALVGVLFDDDSVITDLEIRRRRRGTTFALDAVSPVLAAGLELGREFVYVELNDAPLRMCFHDDRIHRIAGDRQGRG